MTVVQMLIAGAVLIVGFSVPICYGIKRFFEWLYERRHAARDKAIQDLYDQHDLTREE